MRERITLLIVDDSEDDCLLYRRALSQNPDVDYSITEVEDGDEALRRIALETPDCILLDYSLPGRNGIEVLKRIRAAHQFVPVLMLTGQGNESVAVEAMQQGAQNYISKSSIIAEHLQRAIQIAIAHCSMERKLHEQHASLEIFTRALAHDLKEPVRTVKSFLGILADSETLSTQGRSYFAFVQSAADRMGALIDAVYDFTRLDGSAPAGKREACDVKTLLDEAKNDIAELISERRAVISADDMPIVEADRSRLRQVLQNLICNAIHHVRSAPVIHVAAEERHDQWIFSVSDNGDGVPPEQRSKVFEPFTRMSEPDAKGLGMGLAISRRIVEAHGGRIWCDAAPSGGARFLFSISKSATATKSAPNEIARTRMNEPSTAASAPLATVLVVDDNDAAIELARIMLIQSSKLRCNIMSARSGEEAIEILRQQSEIGQAVDVMLLDINMPRMDGFQVLEQVVSASDIPTPTIVMCSTSSYDRDIERARALGASGYVEKPPQLAKLRPLFMSLPSIRLHEDGAGVSLLRIA